MNKCTEVHRDVTVANGAIAYADRQPARAASHWPFAVNADSYVSDMTGFLGSRALFGFEREESPKTFPCARVAVTA